jgi:hypothetical protein
MTESPNELTIEKALGVPTVLTTVGAQGGVLVDPIFSQLSEDFPEVTPIDRTTKAAWSDPNLRAAVEATGRTKPAMADLWTEVCLIQTVLPALKDGFEVYIVSDRSGGVSNEAHEWAPDYASPERSLLNDVVLQHGGGVGLSAEYMIAQISARLVPAPARPTEPARYAA